MTHPDRPTAGPGNNVGHTTGPRRRVLAADRDRQLLAQLRHTLPQYGFEVDTCTDYRELLVEAAATAPDAVLLDAGLPGPDLALVVRLISRRLSILLVLATTDGAPDDEITRLPANARITCVGRPYRLEEVLTRLSGPLPVLAAPDQSGTPRSDMIRIGDLALDPVGYQVTCHGRLVVMPLREFELLARLMEHPNQVLSRDRLAREVWGAGHMPDSNTVSVHMTRLRRRLAEPPASCCRIDTVRGLGYRLLCV